MKKKKLLICAVAVALCSIGVQDFSSADAVFNYDQLQTQVGAGDSNITLGADIPANAGASRTTNSAATTVINMAAGRYINGPSMAGGLFVNNNTLTINADTGASINTGNGTAAAVINSGTFNVNGDLSIGGGINQASGTTTIGGGRIVSLGGNTNVITGGSLVIEDSVTLLQIDDGSIASTTNVTINSDTTLLINGASVSLAGGTTWGGNVNVTLGALSLTGVTETTTATSTYNQSGGSLALTDGTSLNLATSDSEITGGTLNVGGAGNSITFDNGATNTAILSITGGTATVNAGSTFTTAATGNTLTSGSLVADGTFNFSNTDSMSVGTTITGTGAINKDASGSVIFTADNSGFTGTYSQTAGTIQIQNEFFEGDNSFTGGSVLVNNASGDLTLDTGDTWNGASLNVSAGTLTLDGISHTANGANGAYNQTAGSGTLALENGASLTLESGSTITTGNVNLTGTGAANTLTVNGGTLDTLATVSIASGDSLVVQAGAVRLDSGDTWAGDVSMSGGNLTLDGVTRTASAATGAYTQTAGNLTLQNSSSFTLMSGSTITGGSLNVGDAGNRITFGNGATNTATLSMTGGETVVNGGSTFTTAATGNALASGSLVSNGTFNFSNTDIETVGAAITGAGTINKDAAGSIVFTADNSGFTGTYSQTAGDIVIQNKFFAGDNSFTAGQVDINTAAGALTLNSGDTWNGASLNLAAGTVTLDGFSHATSNGGYSQSGGALNLQNGSGLTLEGGTISGGNVNLTGTGAANTLTVDGGIIDIGATVSIASGDSITIQSGAVTLDGTDTWAGDVSMSGGSLALDALTHTANATNGAYNQTAGDLTLQNSSSLTLESGSTITGGSINVAAGNSITFDNGTTNTATLTMVGGTTTVNTGSTFTTAATNNALTGGSLVADGTFNFSNTDSISIGAAITGTGTINKDAAGTLAFTADNSGFTGAFNQTAGDIEIQNAFFAGDNSFAGNSVTINGASGALTLNAGDTWNGSLFAVSAGTLTFDGFSHTASAANGSYAQTGGTLDLQNGSGFTLASGSAITAGNVNLTGTGAANTLTVNGGTLASGATVSIANGDTLALQSGTATLDGTDTWAGDVNVLGGTLTLDGVTRTASVANGAYNQTAGALVLTNNTGLTLETGSDITGGSITVGAAGNSITFDNGATNTAVLSVTGGTATVNSGSTFTTAATGNVLDNGSLVAEGTFNFSNTDSMTVGTTITGSGAINKDATGTLIFTADNSGFAGDYSQTAGDIEIQNVFFAGNNSFTGGNVSVNAAAGALTLNTGDIWNGANISVSAGTVALDGLSHTANATNGAYNQTAGTLAMIDSSSLVLETGSDITGGDINIGTGVNSLSFDNGTTNTATLTMTGGTLTVDTGSTFTTATTGNGLASGSLVADGTFNFSNTDSINVGTTITGAGTINQNAAGTLAFTADNSGFTGAFNQTAGDIEIQNAFFAGDNSFAGNSVTINGASGALTLNAGDTWNGSLFAVSAGTLTFDGFSHTASAANGSYAQTGGTLDLQNGSGFTLQAGSTITGGTVDVGAAGNSMTFDNGAGSTAILAMAGGTTTVNAGSTFTTAATGNALTSGSLVADGTFNFSNTDSTTVGAAITGTGAINKDAAGTVIFTADNSGFTGGYTQTVGDIEIRDAFFAGDNTFTSGNVGLTSTGSLILNAGDTWAASNIDNDGSLSLVSFDPTGTRTGTYTQNAATSSLALSGNSVFVTDASDVITNGSVSIANTATLSIDNGITGSANLTMTGGTLNVTGNSTFNAAAAGTTLTAGDVNINAGSTLGLNSNTTWTGVNIDNTGTLNLDGMIVAGRTGNYTQSGASSALNISNGAAITLWTGDSLAAGAANISDETSALLLVNGATWTGTDITNGGFFGLSNFNDTGRTGSYTQTSADANLLLGNGANMTLIAGDTLSNGQLSITNATTVFTVDNGAVNSAMLTLNSGKINVNSGSTYQTGTTGNTYAAGSTINSNGTFNFRDNDDKTVASTLTGNGLINKTGSDALTFTANNSGFTGDLNVYAGTANFTNGSYIAGTTNLDGASASNLAKMNLTFNSNSNYTQKVAMVDNSVLTLDTGNYDVVNTSNTAITGTVGTNSALRKVGAGTYSVDRTGATADFNYKVAVDAGTMAVKANDAEFNDTVTITGSTFNAAADTLNFNNGLILSNGTMNVLNGGFNVTNGGMTVGSTVNTMNGVVAENNIIGNLNVGPSGTANFLIDIDLRNGTSDKYNISGSITKSTPTGVINISDYNLIGGSPVDSHVLLSVFDPTGTIDPGIMFTQTAKTVDTPIGKYGLLSLGNGLYDFQLTQFNTQVYRGQVATVASYANQLTTNNMLFDHISVVSQQLWAAEHNKKTTTVDEYKYDKKDGNIWYKAFGNIESLRLSQNISTANNMWGSIIGADFPLVEMGNGWSLLPTAYIAYTGGYQAYSGLGMYQNGGQGGLMGTFYKGNFIQTFLTNVGGYGNDMSFSGTKDTTGNWFAGVASKTAYNIALPKDLVLQPTFLLSYNAFGGQNWHTDYGDITMKTNSLNGLLMAPGLNLILNKETWSAYATTQLMFNLMDDCNGLAGNVSLPTIAMGTGYFQYGVGVMKRIKDKFSLYGQIVLSNGTRTGIGFQGGFLWRF